MFHGVTAREAQWSPIALRELLATAGARLSLLAGDLCSEARVESKIGTGRVCGGILDPADQVEADLIVLASLRQAMRDCPIGAKPFRVVRHSRCSVLVVRA